MKAYGEVAKSPACGEDSPSEGRRAELGDRRTDRPERKGLRKADFSAGAVRTRVPRECPGPPNRDSVRKVGEPTASPLKR